MTPAEFAAVIEYLEDRWPGTRNYRNATAAYSDFAHLPAGAARESAQGFYRAGQRLAPAFSELLSATVQASPRHRGDTDPTEGTCDRRRRHGALAIFPDPLVAIVDDRRDSLSVPPEHRLAICSDCHAEVIRPASQLQTETEARVHQAHRQPPPGYDRSDRIAP